MVPFEIVPPDEPYSVEETAEILRKSGRQVLRYLASGALRGSRASGAWTVTAVQIWRFLGIEDEMLANWRAYCRSNSIPEKNDTNQQGRITGE